MVESTRWLSEPKTNWPKSEECLESITEECRIHYYRFQLLRQVVPHYSLGVAFCEKPED